MDGKSMDLRYLLKVFFLLSQWLTKLELLGIPYLVGKISRSKFFFQGPLAK